MRETWLPPLLAALMTGPCWAQDSGAAAPPPLQAPGAAVAALPTALTLAQAVALALERHPGLAAAQSEVQATEAAWLTAGARPAPVLQAEQEDTRRQTRSTTLLVEQAIELGGQRQARLQVAERGRDAALERQALLGGQTRIERVAGDITLPALVSEEALRGPGRYKHAGSQSRAGTGCGGLDCAGVQQDADLLCQRSSAVEFRCSAARCSGREGSSQREEVIQSGRPLLRTADVAALSRTARSLRLGARPVRAGPPRHLTN